MSRRDPWWLALVRWPLWSWGRLVTTVVVALAIGWGVGVGQTWLARTGSPSSSASGVTAGSTSAGSTTTDAATTGSTTTGSATPDPTTSGPAGGTPTTAPASATGAAELAPAGAVNAAREFVTAWARPDLAAQPWWEALSPLCTSTFAAQLHQTDPARVPAHRLVGEPVLAPAGSAGTASTGTASSGSAGAGPAVGSQVVLLAPTDAGGVLVTVVLEGAGWLVTDVEPADAPPAASTAAGEASVAGTPAASQVG